MITFVRHGETDANKQNLFNGKTDLHLNEIGIAQAQKVAENLAGKKFDAVYCSDKLRAIETAEIITGGREFIIDERLTELNCGKFDGRKRNILKDIRFVMSMKKGKNGVEQFDKFMARNIDFFEEVIKPRKGENILIVSHDGNAKTFDFYLKGRPKNYKPPRRLVGNGEVIRFEF